MNEPILISISEDNEEELDLYDVDHEDTGIEDHEKRQDYLRHLLSMNNSLSGSNPWIKCMQEDRNQGRLFKRAIIEIIDHLYLSLISPQWNHP